MQTTSQELIIARELPAIPTAPFIGSVLLGFFLLAVAAMYAGHQKRLLAEDSYNKAVTQLATVNAEKERAAGELAYAQSPQGKKQLAQAKLNYHAKNEIVVTVH